MLEELCKDSFFEACKAVSGPIVQLRGRKSPYMDFYPASGVISYNWKILPLNKMHARGRSDTTYRIRRFAWLYFNENADKMREHYLRVRFERDLRKAMDTFGTFDALFDNFRAYFEERKLRFMENTELMLQQWKDALAKSGKHPQSHGGVANLLKVLNKTLHDQGSSVYTIAKTDYMVCLQAGVYLPDEFLTDVLVAHGMIEEG